jgi:hypothetical protein
MNPQTAKASKIIHAPAQEIYNLLADYRNGHPRVLPREYFLSLEVEEGGFGEGTIVQFQMRLPGQTKRFRSLITEPEPGHVLVETDIQSGIQTMFLVDSAGDAQHSRLTISTELTDRSAAEAFLAKILLENVYRQELELVAQLAQNPIVAKGSHRTNNMPSVSST